MDGTVGLASGSPRRKQILESLGLTVSQLPAGIDETRGTNEAIVDYVARLAREKARFGADESGVSAIPVVAGDTAVALNEQLFDKPRDEAHAVQMLLSLSGKVHQVHTSVAVLWQGSLKVDVVSSSVSFSAITEREAHDYWASGEPEGKAGAYAIQGLGGRFVKHLSGSYTGVMGLPVFEVWKRLTALTEWSVKSS
ncbi:MAG: Maf family protein [Pseudomonadota bacterium]